MQRTGRATLSHAATSFLLMHWSTLFGFIIITCQNKNNCKRNHCIYQWFAKMLKCQHLFLRLACNFMLWQGCGECLVRFRHKKHSVRVWKRCFGWKYLLLLPQTRLENVLTVTEITGFCRFKLLASTWSQPAAFFLAALSRSRHATSSLPPGNEKSQL